MDCVFRSKWFVLLLCDIWKKVIFGNVGFIYCNVISNNFEKLKSFLLHFFSTQKDSINEYFSRRFISFFNGSKNKYIMH